MYFVYLLKLIDGSYYTGISDNVEKRIAKHAEGGVLSTKTKRPIELVFYCALPNKSQAISFEKYLKSGSGQAFRNKHLI